MSTNVRGACLCGEVRFEVILPSKWVAHCHCTMCRRAHGAAFVTWISVPDEQLVMVDQTSLRTHASSADGRRSFCGTCGSPLLFRSSRWPGETHVALASLEGPVDRPPTVHAFWSDRAPWTVVHDGLPRRGGISGLEPLPPEEL